MSAEVPPLVPEDWDEVDERERQAVFERVLDHVFEKDAELFERLRRNGD